MVRSEVDDEIIDHVQLHAEEIHDMEVPEADIRDGWENVEMEAQD